MHRYLNQGQVEIRSVLQPLLIEVVRDYIVRHYDNKGDQNHMVHQYVNGINPEKAFNWDMSVEVRPPHGENINLPSPRALLLDYYSFSHSTFAHVPEVAVNFVAHYCDDLNAQLEDFPVIGIKDRVIEFVTVVRSRAAAQELASKLHAENPTIDYHVAPLTLMRSDYSMKELCKLWNELSRIPVDSQECIMLPFLHFDAGTYSQDIWRWFERNPQFKVSEAGDTIGADHPYWAL